jgi:hypothetical protein
MGDLILFGLCASAAIMVIGVVWSVIDTAARVRRVEEKIDALLEGT